MVRLRNRCFLITSNSRSATRVPTAKGRHAIGRAQSPGRTAAEGSLLWMTKWSGTTLAVEINSIPAMSNCPDPLLLASAERVRRDAVLARFAGIVSTDMGSRELLGCVLECGVELAVASYAVIGIHALAGSSSSPGWSSVLVHGATEGSALGASPVALLDALTARQLPQCGRYQSLPLLGVAVSAGPAQLGVLLLVMPPASSPTDVLGDIKIVAGHAGLAVRNAARIDSERRRTARLEVVAKVAQIINRSGSPIAAVLQLAADAIHEVLEYPNVDIPLSDPEDPEVLVISTRGGSYKWQINQVDRIRIDRGIMGAAARSRRTILCNDVQRDPRYVRPPVPEPSRAELAVPLVAGDQLLGVLNVEGDGPFDELDQLTIEAIAQHLSLAIENAALVSEQQCIAIVEERQRLAFELHDSVTQAVSGVSLLAQALPSAWKKGKREGLLASQRVAELAQLAVGEMRGLLQQLSPSRRSGQIQRTSRRSMIPVGLDQLKDGGLGAALPRLLEVLVPPHIRVRCDFSTYTRQVIEYEQALYRVFQEAASNLVRHSGASALTLVARVDTQRVEVSMRDDGRGCGSDEPQGLGFRSMRQRVSMLGGALKLRSLTPRGFEVVATLKRRDRKSTP